MQSFVKCWCLLLLLFKTMSSLCCSALSSQLLKGKKVLVTGGGRGIGRAIALICHEEGADVIVTSRTQSELEETVRLSSESVQDTQTDDDEKQKRLKQSAIAATLLSRRGGRSVSRASDKTTSVGARRTGAASKARMGRSSVSQLVDAVKTGSSSMAGNSDSDTRDSRTNVMRFHVCDVTDEVQVDSMVREIVGGDDSDGKGIDILINNAAVFTAAPLTEITRADYQQVFSINVAGTLFTMQAVARRMIKDGRQGKIINMASQAGRRGEPLVAVYCATKAAVISLTQSAGLNLIQHGINVNAIAPGVVDGEHWDGVDAFFAKYENKPEGQKKREVGAGVPFGRMATPQDLVGMAVFLASDEADYIVAQTYNVDGGQWMS